MPRFAGDVLDLPVGEVRTDEHCIVLKVSQPDVATTRIEDQPTQLVTRAEHDCADVPDDADTAAGWAVKKQELFDQVLDGHQGRTLRRD